jgi:hypothetical protein
MERTLEVLKAELTACDLKLHTNPDDDTLEKKHQLLKERTDLLIGELNPLRTAISGMLGVELKMAVSKRWGAEFRKLPPTAQLKTYQDAREIAVQLADALRVELPEKETA